ncbi:hypothetical protein [Pseudoteredinibacter isoporae]|uniref:Uncharacterized protein n=1 Tax=Pseudoteredinibacter isoporae TaxID=570281 RepID=A0A7X0JV57_9GAMM|nr:hypothetical protein [Pseudoteredinibacter isoporae]MBB6521886.1 hypothetical protein [Pseudoteredinibacter isoporae]NHO87430.1 hypothetical protein [Pseudoteredinibacter isoporae]NIB24239.1 hypothetical protein [Pseudoteredinibacter isoporae]
MKAQEGTLTTVNLLLLSEIARSSSARHIFFQKIPMVYSLAARAHRVPLDLLYVMSVVLDGRESELRRSERLPLISPWVIMINGLAVRFRSIVAARNVLTQLENSARRVRIGLMRVHYQPRSDTGVLLSPLGNLSHSARILRTHFELGGDWWFAARCYAGHEVGYTKDQSGEFERKLQEHIHFPFEER